MKKICSKCKTEFECKADDISNCHCSKSVLSEEITQYIQMNHTDCLCPECLKKIAQNEIKDSHH